MKNFSRREFIYKSAASVAAVSAMSPLNFLHAKERPLISEPIGFQSWMVRELIAKDFGGTLKMMSGLGYQTVEMCSPPGYAKHGFGSLQSLKAPEMKKIITDAGLSCTSSHYGFNELKESGQERMDFANELGLTQMVIASFGLPEQASLSDWKKAADEANSLGELAKKNRMQMVFHNHNIEFEKLEGKIIYDELLERLDPELVKMQFQLWVVIAGYKAADYFKKYPGRFISAHLSDWSGKAEEQVTLGKGTIDWKEFFKASKVGGLKNFFVEMDLSTLKESAIYLKSL
jgi:sugar phosphate isomerase/epimerase